MLRREYGPAGQFYTVLASFCFGAQKSLEMRMDTPGAGPWELH